MGVASDTKGEAVHAFVVAEQPAPTADALIAHAREQLSAYKVPESITFVDELPKSPIGKILRRELRDLVATSQEGARS